MNEHGKHTEINVMIKEYLKSCSKGVQEFCLLAIEKAQELPVPDVIEILRTSAKDFISVDKEKTK